MINNKKIEKDVLRIGEKAKLASLKVSLLSTMEKNDILLDAADNIKKNKSLIIQSNEMDVDKNKNRLNSALLDRLMLDSNRIDNVCNGLVEIAKLEDPVGKVLDEWERPNGLKIQKISIPLGVIGVIYESRPNVAADAAEKLGMDTERDSRWIKPIFFQKYIDERFEDMKYNIDKSMKGDDDEVYSW